ncbi:MAG: hypothetical protein M1820_007288 [Bogoriella megaspora]|nr:MAG: hypothetical protein M1820_007288 [Bogoriella megaspora]
MRSRAFFVLFSIVSARATAQGFNTTVSKSTAGAEHGWTMTFYGRPDNTPTSVQTAHNCGGRNNIAGGIGTFTNPLTFAAAEKGPFKVCEIIWGIKHLDVWAGNYDSKAQTDCENSLTPPSQSQTIIRNPKTEKYEHQVNTAPLFDPDRQTQFQQAGGGDS